MKFLLHNLLVLDTHVTALVAVRIEIIDFSSVFCYFKVTALVAVRIEMSPIFILRPFIVVTALVAVRIEIDRN